MGDHAEPRRFVDRDSLTPGADHENAGPMGSSRRQPSTCLLLQPRELGVEVGDAKDEDGRVCRRGGR